MSRDSLRFDHPAHRLRTEKTVSGILIPQVPVTVTLIHFVQNRFDTVIQNCSPERLPVQTAGFKARMKRNDMPRRIKPFRRIEPIPQQLSAADQITRTQYFPVPGRCRNPGAFRRVEYRVKTRSARQRSSSGIDCRQRLPHAFLGEFIPAKAGCSGP